MSPDDRRVHRPDAEQSEFTVPSEPRVYLVSDSKSVEAARLARKRARPHGGSAHQKSKKIW